MAGYGTYDFSGDAGKATSAGLASPDDVAVDVLGNVYIADSGNNCIRLVTKSTGIITTVAGTGSSGYSGDGGRATLAKLSYPRGIAVDGSGNFYIADTYANRIRVVAKGNGIITTVAGTGSIGSSGDGGLATLATIYNPRTLAVDTSRNIYVADSGNNRIRVITKSTGIISTVAGTGSSGTGGDGGLATLAALNYPYGVAVDTSGNVYIADTLSHRVRLVTKSTGIITTIAGIGSSGSSGDGGQATTAALNYPCDITIDASGNVYIADTDNYRIRMVTNSSGNMSTVAGTGSNDYSGDGGQATSATLYNSRGVTSDAAGNIYIADAGNNRVRMFLHPQAVSVTPSPSATPTLNPTARPTRIPSPSPTASPSIVLTPTPTAEPSLPSPALLPSPTESPSNVTPSPTAEPSLPSGPTCSPSMLTTLTAEPSLVFSPTFDPTLLRSPTESPSTASSSAEPSLL
jgi:trimeric autotransporter adhesin